MPTWAGPDADVGRSRRRRGRRKRARTVDDTTLHARTSKYLSHDAVLLCNVLQKATVAGGEPSSGADVVGGEPPLGADVVGVGPAPAQMWQGGAQSRRRCGRGEPQSRCRCGHGLGRVRSEVEHEAAVQVDALLGLQLLDEAALDPRVLRSCAGVSKSCAAPGADVGRCGQILLQTWAGPDADQVLMSTWGRSWNGCGSDRGSASRTSG